MTHTEFGKLKAVIVGKELELNNRVIDNTFKIFYQKNISNNQFTDYKDYSINSKLIEERNEDLNNLAKILESFDVKVYRPESVRKSIPIQTPYFKGLQSSASNVRDLIFTYANKIIETPVLIQGRFFENYNLYPILKEYFLKDYLWLKAPTPILTPETFDDQDWDICRDFKNIDPKWDLGIDAAQYLKIGKDILCNISTYNHYFGSKWMKSVLPEANIHIIDSMIDNHLDGNILPLCPGKFLVNESSLEKPIIEYLPDKFKKWDIIKTDNNYKHNLKNYNEYNTPFVQLCSYRGMDMNILSIDEKNVLVNEDAVYVQEALYQNGFNIIPVRLRHCELFGGGIHCSTLDMEREDEFIDYTK